MGKSIDEKGRQRWLSLNLIHHWEGDYPDWLVEYSSHPLRKVNFLPFIF